MKILYLTKYQETGIVEAPALVARYYMKHSKYEDHQIRFLCYFQEGDKYSRKEKLFGFKKIDENIYRSGLLPLILFVIRFKPRIIHLLTLETYYTLIFPLKKIIGFKLIYTMHGAMSYELKKLKRTGFRSSYRVLCSESLALSAADSIVVLSERMRRYLRIIKKIPDRKISIGANGIELKPFSESAPVIKSKKIKIAASGNINRPEKGYPFLIDALRLSDYEFELNVYSTSPQEMPEDLIVPENVTLNLIEPLDTDAYRNELSGNHLFIAPSRYDVFNMSLLEAMNAGLLVITTDRVGLAERFPPDLRFLLVPYGQPELLIAKIHHLAGMDEEELDKLRRRLYDISLKFGWDSVLKELAEKIYAS